MYSEYPTDRNDAVNHPAKQFPEEFKIVKNTSKFQVDNSLVKVEQECPTSAVYTF